MISLHQQQLIIGNQMFRPPCSSPHQWYIASYNTHNLKENTEKSRCSVRFGKEIATCTIVSVVPARYQCSQQMCRYYAKAVNSSLIFLSSVYDDHVAKFLHFEDNTYTLSMFQHFEHNISLLTFLDFAS